MYMFGKIKRCPYGRLSYVQRQKANRIARQMNYLFFHGLDTKEKVVERKATLEERLLSIETERKRLRKERRKYESTFHHAKEIGLCEGTDRDRHKKWLSAHGYDGEEGLQTIKTLREKYSETFFSLRQQRKEMEKERSMLDRILKENLSTADRHGGENNKNVANTVKERRQSRNIDRERSY